MEVNKIIQGERTEMLIDLYSSGLSYTEIGKRFNISRQRVHQLVKGYRPPASKKHKIKVFIIKSIKSINLPLKPITIIGNNLPLHLKPAVNMSIYTIRNKSTDLKVNPKFEGKDFLREKVRVRDNYTCQICYEVWIEGNRRFDVHHTDPEKEGKNGNIYKNNKDFYQMITLCHKCHLNLDSVRKKMSDAYYENNKIIGC